MKLFIFIFYLSSLGLYLNDLNHLFLILFILFSFIIVTWSHNESWDNLTLKGIKGVEIFFVLFLLSILFLFISWKVNIIWVVFLLEFQSFMILGACYLFKNESLKVKEIEGSLNYIFPAFFSFVLMLVYILGVSIKFYSIYFNNITLHFILLISILTKVGAFPVYAWVSNVFHGVTYSTLLFISIISKIFMIIILLEYIKVYTFLLLLGGFMSVVISSFVMINQVRIKKFLAFSSVANIGWVLLVLMIPKNEEIFYLYTSEILTLFFFIYAFNFILLCSNLKQSSITQTYNLFNIIKSEKQSTLFFFIIGISLLSMAGVPPFAGFIGKFIIFTYYFSYSLSFTLILVFISSLFIFIYLRPVISTYRVNLPYSNLLRQNIKGFYNSSNFIVFTPFLLILNFMIMFIIFHKSF